jgi:Gamma-glutamyl cyclotransferase, AIG2-like
VDVFFYGLFMDGDVLRDSHVSPADPRRAYADGFALRIGRRATLTPSAGGRVYGMVYALTQAELDRLYAAPGLEQYRPETIPIRTFGGESLSALCYNLATAPQPGEANAEYAARLRDVLAKLGFPREYIDAVA